MGFARRAVQMAAKDLRLEWRTREKLSSMGFFSILLLVTLHFSFDFTGIGFEEVGIGVLWVCVTFAGVVGLGQSFLMEREQDCIVGLLLCPGDRSAVYAGKLLSNLVFVVLVEGLVLALAALLFNFNLLAVLAPLSVVLLLYTIGFVALGTFFSAMSARVQRGGGVLLTILLFPLLLPLLMASVRAAGRLLDGASLADVNLPLIFCACYDVIVLAGSLMLFEFVVEE